METTNSKIKTEFTSGGGGCSKVYLHVDGTTYKIKYHDGYKNKFNIMFIRDLNTKKFYPRTEIEIKPEEFNANDTHIHRSLIATFKRFGVNNIPHLWHISKWKRKYVRFPEEIYKHIKKYREAENGM